MSKLVKNIAYQASYQILTMILPLATVPYIARVLGPEPVGIYSYTSAVSNYFVLFATLGLSSHGSRVIATQRGRDRRSEAFSQLVAAHSIVALPVIAVYLFYVLVFGRDYLTVFLAQGLLVFSACIDISWFYFGIEEFRITVLRNVIVKILTVVAIFAFVKDEQDLILYTTIMALGNLLGILVLWVPIKRYVEFVPPSVRESIKHIKPMAVLFVAVLATNIYHTIGKVFLGGSSQMVELACFEYADKFIQIPVALITSFGTVMLPRMTSLYSEGDSKGALRYITLAVEVIFWFSGGLAFGIISVRETLTSVFLGDQYELTSDLLLIMAPAIMFIAFANVIRSQYLIPKRKDRYYLVAVVIAALANFVFNWTFIPVGGAIVAAWGSSIAYLLVFLLQNLAIEKDIRLASLLKSAIAPIAIGAISCATTRMLASFLTVGPISLVIQFVVFVSVFFAMGFAYLGLCSRSAFADLFRSVVQTTFKKIIR